MFKEGQRIRILSLDDPWASRYIGKEGIIECISKDPYGDIRLDGTWCSIGLYPFKGDIVEVID